jgi:hypothetical protein
MQQPAEADSWTVSHFLQQRPRVDKGRAGHTWPTETWAFLGQVGQASLLEGRSSPCIWQMGPVGPLSGGIC